MSKKGYISRYLLILKKIKTNKYITLEELRKVIQRELEIIKQLDDTIIPDISERTLQRDFKEINTLFGTTIEYSHKHRGYFIEQSNYDGINFQRVLDEFEIYQSLNIAEDIKPFINIEKRENSGLENLYGIIHAIKNNLILEYTYNFFDISQIYKVKCEPYALKEFKNRWYLVAFDKKDNFIKTFALERITDFIITQNKFSKPENFDIKKFFNNSFGILTHIEEEPIKIKLKFTQLQAQYIRLKPLHHSQKIIKDTEKELVISLNIQNTFDFRMELLSYGNSVTVIEPEILKNQLIEIYKRSLLNYEL